MPASRLTVAPTLADVLRGYVDAPPLPLTGITCDSRAIEPGALFLACRGARRHGIDYAVAAEAAGAAAVAYDSSTALPPPGIGIPVLAVEHLGDELGEIANRYYGFPSHRLNVVGVTGTNGKTTISWLVAQCLEMLGARCGYIGTLGYGIGTLQGAAGLTTPAVTELQARLAEFVAEDAGYAAIEVSSHALAQRRVDGVRFAAALFSNLSRDHLDYHGDMRAYFEAKARLFLECDTQRRIIDVDTEWGAELATRCGGGAVVVSTQPVRPAQDGRHLYARAIRPAADGSEVDFDGSWGSGSLVVPMPGAFNVANALLVLALLLDLGVDNEAAAEALSRASAPPGRLQRVSAHGVSAYVDYAHTPDALEAALHALRAHCRGRLWCLFGCGGERDPGKRPLMGRVAEQLADIVVVTSDNPRHEAATDIIDGIVGGLAEPDRATAIEDRAAAIAWAISSAREGDSVLIAGKGHEDYQLVGERRLPFSDFALARALLGRRDGGKG